VSAAGLRVQIDPAHFRKRQHRFIE
jgi:hypothetical protein